MSGKKEQKKRKGSEKGKPPAKAAKTGKGRSQAILEDDGMVAPPVGNESTMEVDAKPKVTSVQMTAGPIVRGLRTSTYSCYVCGHFETLKSAGKHLVMEHVETRVFNTKQLKTALPVFMSNALLGIISDYAVGVDHICVAKMGPDFDFEFGSDEDELDIQPMFV